MWFHIVFIPFLTIILGIVYWLWLIAWNYTQIWKSTTFSTFDKWIQVIWVFKSSGNTVCQTFDTEASSWSLTVHNLLKKFRVQWNRSVKKFYLLFILLYFLSTTFELTLSGSSLLVLFFVLFCFEIFTNVSIFPGYFWTDSIQLHPGWISTLHMLLHSAQILLVWSRLWKIIS